MSASDCLPLEQLPGATPLFRAYAEAGTRLPESLADYYALGPQSDAWMSSTNRPRGNRHADPVAVADLLEKQNRGWGAGAPTLANIELLRQGARVVVTGQQVSLFGGPLYSLLKAATAVQLARQASARGFPHVPVFWLATEDHDFAEVNAVTVLAGRSTKDLHLCDVPKTPLPVGGWVPGDCLQKVVAEATALLGGGAAGDLLRECYAPGASLAEAFARLFLKLFSAHGLIVMDASGRAFHKLAAPVLAQALEQAAPLHQRLVARDAHLKSAGFHSQVLVNDSSSLLFLLDDAGSRLALRRSGDVFVAGSKKFSAADLQEILLIAPERISPNALLRPVMQDFLLPTSAYIGGPAEVAYFAQSQVLYDAILGTTTPILPRLSATLISPQIRRLLIRYELQVEQTWTIAEVLALRLGARAMPLEAKQKLKDAGSALHAELDSLQQYATQIDEALGHTASVAASKIRYQMNRLRRMMAKFELEKQKRLSEHAELLSAYLHPEGGLQERKLAGMQFVAEQGTALIDRLVEEAADRCPGHKIIQL